MTETSSSPSALSSKKMTELKEIASGLGIKGITSMRKAELVSAIQSAGAGKSTAAKSSSSKQSKQQDKPAASSSGHSKSNEKKQSSAELVSDAVGALIDAQSAEPKTQERVREREQDRAAKKDAAAGQSNNHGNQNNNQPKQNNGDQSARSSGQSNRRRNRRNRDRSNRRPRSSSQVDDTVRPDDVLTETQGIVDVLDNYAFIRTSGYLPGPDDAYVSLSMVRKHGLRKGDVITGAIRQPREGDRKEKFNPLVRIDTINGRPPAEMANRVHFSKLTPLYPQRRLKMETDPKEMTGRIIDLIAPIGMGQRGLIVSPPKAGKTMALQTIANAITTNNPDVHLMVVLVDERPEEVTDFQRTTSAEVIASTFDRPAEDHTTIAELAIERAKRLVEIGQDVVILLDGITRLSRAYNLAAPASGRILSGGVDSAALYPPKKFFGAARNIENGGSLTILATALVETGSKMDEVIFEEFKGTGNMELRLSRNLADKRMFPAIDVESSGTRREDLLLGRTELEIIWKLRRALSGLDDTQVLETLLSRMRKTENNATFLVSITANSGV